MKPEEALKKVKKWYGTTRGILPFMAFYLLLDEKYRKMIDENIEIIDREFRRQMGWKK